MKRLLCLVCCIATLQSFSQVTGTVMPYTTLYGDSVTYVNKLILERYCNDFMLLTPSNPLSDLYNPQPNLQIKFDQHVVAIYNPVMLSYTFYPTNNIPFVETNMGKASGVFYGPVKSDSFNPYGSTSLSQALFNGSINYLLNRPRR